MRLELRETLDLDIGLVFDLWTRPEHLLRWWGPKDVECIAAEVDLRPGGRYRLENKMPDGSILVIGGEYLEIERPSLLKFTWELEPPMTETVTVILKQFRCQTEIILLHEKILTESIKHSHRRGWLGCFDKLRGMRREFSQLDSIV